MTNIIAQDVRNKNGDIIKRYIKGRVDQLKQLWASQPGWVAPLVEICLERPTRLFMDIESTAPADVVQRGLTAICKYIEYDLKVVPEVISSCSEQKQSYHIVAPVFFKNVHHAGAWVRKCYQYMQTRIAVNKENHAGISLEDVRAVHERVHHRYGGVHAQSRISHVWLIQTRVPSRVDPSTSCMARFDGAARAASRCGTVDSVGIR